MAKKRRKGRSVKNNKNQYAEPEEYVRAPHSFVIHRGLLGDHIVELTRDFRRVMEPFTASHLKEKKNNSIKDFVSISGLLHVSHLSIFSKTELGMYMKLCRLPRGPTLTFKVQRFSLARDVVSSLKKQLVIEDAFKHSPLVIMNGFSGDEMHLKLMASVFQNMFPTINLTNVDLNTVRRCVLLNYNTETKTTEFRHYNIKVIPVGISKGVKKVIQGKVPNLSKCDDISDFLMKSTLLSESEAEDDPNHQVVLSQKIKTRGNLESGKSSIKLTELGPRLTLQLMKIEDGLLDGEVLYHDLIYKSEEEKLVIQKKREAKKKLKEQRKKIQEENKKMKERGKEEQKEKSLEGMKKHLSETDQLMKKSLKEAREIMPEAVDDDAKYYTEEVGEKPDEDLFTQKTTGKRMRPQLPYKKKKFKPDKVERTKRGKVEKTNAANRDFRPIGGKMKSKSKRRK